MTAPDLSFSDYPERDPQKLRIHCLELALKRAARHFRMMGSSWMAKECEAALQSLPSHPDRSPS